MITQQHIRRLANDFRFAYRYLVNKQSFSKSGNLLPSKKSFAPGEFCERLRSALEAALIRQKDAPHIGIFVSVALQNGSETSKHVDRFEEFPAIMEPGHDLRFMELTITNECFLTISFNESFWWVSLNVERIEFLMPLWTSLLSKLELLEQNHPKSPLREIFGPDAEQPEEKAISKISEVRLFCESKAINWPVIQELPARLSKLGFNVDSLRITIDRYPKVFEFRTLEDLFKNLQQNGPPNGYNMWFYGPHSGEHLNIHNVGEAITLTFAGNFPEQAIDNVRDFLALAPKNEQKPKPQLQRSCFIAYRFDELGHKQADTLEKFLRLLGFHVSTGWAFSPEPISEKVKSRMSQQSTVFAILTPGDDKTWLVQESFLGSATGKPLFLLKESGYQHNSGILGDHEYIPFEAPHIEKTFIPILEGLRGLGFEL